MIFLFSDRPLLRDCFTLQAFKKLPLRCDKTGIVILIFPVYAPFADDAEPDQAVNDLSDFGLWHQVILSRVFSKNIIGRDIHTSQQIDKLPSGQPLFVFLQAGQDGLSHKSPVPGTCFQVLFEFLFPLPLPVPGIPVGGHHDPPEGCPDSDGFLFPAEGKIK